MIAPTWLPTWSSLAPVVNHVWQSTIFAVMAAILALALRREGAHVRYWVWLTASLKFLIPSAALVALGHQVTWHPPVAAPQQTIALIQSVSEAYSRTQLHLATGTVPKVAGSTLAAALPAVLVIAWMLGCAVYLFVCLGTWRRLAAIVHGACPLENGREFDSLRRLAQAQGMTRPVPLLATGHALEPGVFGIVKPVLLWPLEIGRQLNHVEVEAILAHEVCHVRRRDNLGGLIQMLVQAIFWFHPFVWWVGARLLDEREQACDQGVIRLGSEPHIYARSVLKTCKFCIESPLVCVSGVTGSNLKRRIESIMRGDGGTALTVWKKCLLGAAGAVALAAPIAVGVVDAPRLLAQQAAADSDTSFEVASVKANKSGSMQTMMQAQPGGRLVLTNATLRMLIRNAYHVQDFQITGGPDWLNSDRFDIVTKAAGNPSMDQLELMLRSLLTDRFKLAVRHETRDLPIYALELARTDGKLGPQLRAGVHCTPRGNAPPQPVPSQAFPPFGQPLPCGLRIGPGSMEARGVEMRMLAETLSNQAGRVVLDRTGLSGEFDFDLTWTPDRLPQGPPPPGAPPFPPIDPNGPSIFTAVQEQLGLKLEPTKGLVDVLVVDHAEQPTEN